MILDGRAIAAEVLDDVRARAARLPEGPSFLALAVAPSAATESYLRMKARQAEGVGIRMEVRVLADATEDELLRVVRDAAQDAVIVQLPLPAHMRQERVLEGIPPEKDADVLSPVTRAQGVLVHPVAGAIQKVLKAAGTDPQGKRAVVVGNGWLVGQPAAAWLRTVCADVTVVTKSEGDLAAACREADIFVSGAGVAGLIGPEAVKPGATVIDVGTSELGGSIAGDVRPEAAAVAGAFTPVPGGVGPITVACLLSNVVDLAEARFAK